jgi:hypothetical protein
MSAFDAVVHNDQNDGSGCQRLRARSARFPISVLDLMQRLRHKAELSKIVSTLTERDLRGLNARVVAYPLRLAGGRQCPRQLRPRAPLRRADTYRERPDREWYRAADAKPARRLM